MKYEAWLNYGDRTISIENLNGKYRCSEFGPEETVKRSFKDCDSNLELKFFLLSFANAPKKEIIQLLKDLQKKKLKALDNK